MGGGGGAGCRFLGKKGGVPLSSNFSPHGTCQVNCLFGKIVNLRLLAVNDFSIFWSKSVFFYLFIFMWGFKI